MKVFLASMLLVLNLVSFVSAVPQACATCGHEITASNKYRGFCPICHRMVCTYCCEKNQYNLEVQSGVPGGSGMHGYYFNHTDRHLHNRSYYNGKFIGVDKEPTIE